MKKNLLKGKCWDQALQVNMNRVMGYLLFEAMLLFATVIGLISWCGIGVSISFAGEGDAFCLLSRNRTYPDTVMLPTGNEHAAKVLKTNPMPIEYSELVVSLVGQRYAWSRRNNDGSVLMLDGKKYPRRLEVVRDLGFTKNGEVFVCRSSGGPMSTICINGEFGKSYPGVEDLTILNRKDVPVLYTMKKSNEGQGMRAVIGRQPATEWVNSVSPFVVSPDGTRFAYHTRRGKTKISVKKLVVDGTHYGPYGGFGKMLFSPDSKRFAAVIQQNGKHHKGKCYLWVDGQIQIPWEISKSRSPKFKELVFSPDSSRLGSVVSLTKKGMCGVVVDGKPVGTFPDVSQLAFSPDGKHFAYVSKERKSRKQNVYLDGRLYYSPDAVVQGEVGSRLVFSPDGSQLAFAYCRDGQNMVVANGNKMGKSYDNHTIHDLTYNIKNQLYYTASIGRETFLVRDGDEIIQSRGQIYTNDRHTIIVYAMPSGKTQAVGGQKLQGVHIALNVKHETFGFYDNGTKFAYVGEDEESGLLHVYANGLMPLQLRKGGSYQLLSTEEGACFQETSRGELLLAVVGNSPKGDGQQEIIWLQVP